MRRLPSKDLVARTREDLQSKFGAYRERGITPSVVAFVFNGSDAVSSYVASKSRLAGTLGVVFSARDYSHIQSEQEALAVISEAAAEALVEGIIIELPAKVGWSEVNLLNAVPASKDLDGLSSESLAGLMQDRDTVAPATPQACILLAQEERPLSGQNVVVVGRGRTVGRPLANMLIGSGATVTVCHSRTRSLEAITKQADIVFLATGRGGEFGRNYFRDGQVIIDAGISVVEGRVVGDANLAELEDLDVAVTPVPGGVGPLTSILLFRNLAKLMATRYG